MHIKPLLTTVACVFLIISVNAQDAKVVPPPPTKVVKEWTKNTFYWHPMELFLSYMRLAYETDVGTSGNSLLVGSGAILQKGNLFNQRSSTVGLSAEIHYRVSLLTDPEKGYRLFLGPYGRYLYIEERGLTLSKIGQPAPPAIINSYIGGLTIGVKSRMLKVFYFCTYTGFAAKYSENSSRNVTLTLLGWGYTGIVPVFSIQFGVKI